MNLVAAATHHARTVVLTTIMLVVAGLVAAWQLPSSIYPPLEFPRIVIIAHSGTLPTRGMTLSVTRPLEQAAMSAPGVRRVRSRTFRGAAEVDAYFDASTDMVVALGSNYERLFIIPSMNAIIVRQGWSEKFSDASFLRLVLGR